MFTQSQTTQSRAFTQLNGANCYTNGPWSTVSGSLFEACTKAKQQPAKQRSSAPALQPTNKPQQPQHASTPRTPASKQAAAN